MTDDRRCNCDHDMMIPSGAHHEGCPELKSVTDDQKQLAGVIRDALKQYRYMAEDRSWYLDVEKADRALSALASLENAERERDEAREIGQDALGHAHAALGGVKDERDRYRNGLRAVRTSTSLAEAQTAAYIALFPPTPCPSTAEEKHPMCRCDSREVGPGIYPRCLNCGGLIDAPASSSTAEDEERTDPYTADFHGYMT